MLLPTAALGGILLAAGTPEPGYPSYGPAPPYAPAAQAAGAGQHAPQVQYAPAPPSAAPREHPGYAAPTWSGSAVRQAAFEVPASPQGAGDQEAGPISVTPPGGRPSMPVTPPGGPSEPGAQGRGGPGSAVTVVGALGLVLGIFLLTAWGIRRAAPQALHPLPGEVFEVLGRAPLAGRQQAHLLRLGNKLVLVSLSPAGAETLTEITDPVEVDRVAGLCRQAQPGSATAVFRHVLDQFAPRRSTAGEIGRTSGPSHEAPHERRTGSPSYGPAEPRHG
jgi:flagellar biogenesis protein FliO